MPTDAGRGATGPWRLAMLDVDGTLRDEEGWKAHARQLVVSLDEAGLHVALCSGRNTESLQGIAVGRPQITFIAAGSGSLVQARSQDGWTTLEHRHLSADTVAWVVDQAATVGMELWAYTDDAWLVESANERVTAESHYVGARATVGAFVGRGDIVKLLAFPLSRAHRSTLDRIDAQRDLAVVQSYPGYFDIVRTESAAAKGGDVLVRHLGITWDQVLAVGDGENDLGMLGKAGIAMAMAPLRSTLLVAAASNQLRFDCPDLTAVIHHLTELGVMPKG